MESMWSKSAGAWRQVYPTPSVPTTVVLTAGEGASGVANLSWTASTVEYTTVASYELDQDGVVSDVGNVLLKQVTGLSDGTAYAFKVRAVAAFTGERGAWSNVVSVTPAVPWNAATGGLEQMVSNYNGTGQRWMVHTFTGSGTLNVSRAAQPFRVLVVGGGGAGRGAGGGGGGVIDTSTSLTVGALPVTVGGSGNEYDPGESSTIGGITAGGGDHGGNGAGTSGAPQSNLGGAFVADGALRSGGGGAGGVGGDYNASRAGGAGVPTNITGTTQRLAGGGGGGVSNNPPGSGQDGGGNGGNSAQGTPGTPSTGGGGGGWPPGGTNAIGGSGIVIVAYRVL